MGRRLKFNGARMMATAAYCREYRARPGQKEKDRARRLCRKAVAAGKLIKSPCEKCGCEMTEGHHEDYSKPLEIRWLCKPCHGQTWRRLTCLRGHERTPENLKKRACRICDAAQRKTRRDNDQ